MGENVTAIFSLNEIFDLIASKKEKDEIKTSSKMIELETSTIKMEV